MIVPSRAANNAKVNWERNLIRKLLETGSVPILLTLRGFLSASLESCGDRSPANRLDSDPFQPSTRSGDVHGGAEPMKIRMLSYALVALATCVTFAATASADEPAKKAPTVEVVEGYVGDMAPGIQRGYGQPDLFYNFYTQGAANRANAQMYLSPMPIPPNVGHTFYTYQPFYPHHMLYPHQNRFHRNYDCGRGMNRTRASYYYPPVRQTASNVYWNFLRMPR
jgi:hypothetical protein